jgi:catalase (peroxidase I)
MSEIIAKFDAGQIIGLVAVVIGPIVAIVAILTHQWRKVRIAEMEGALKQQMLDKGMSAAEIEQVLGASQEPARRSSCTGNPAQDRIALAERMIEEGYEGADIERVLKAYDPNSKFDEKMANQKV